MMHLKTIDLPFVMVIFGGTGDLARRKILPSLYSLHKSNYLPEDFHIISIGRRVDSNEEYYQSLIEFLPQGEDYQSFFSHISFFQLDVTERDGFTQLRNYIHAKEQEMKHECLSKLYYMAVGADVLEDIVEHMGNVGLHIGCGEEGKWSRIIIEKPFGYDLSSANKLNTLILKYFQEEQIYRIDHYLGKELVQTILSIRFANAFFYPLWSREYIDHIQITAFETLGMEGRGAFYDKTGALRDLVQSHLLQLIALATMREPQTFSADEIRNKKYQVLKAIRNFDEQSICTDILHGQYDGYKDESHIHPDSLTETYVAFKTFVDLPEWNGVPIYIRTGKRMSKKSTAIHFQFKPHCSPLYCPQTAQSSIPELSTNRKDASPNVLSILLAPEEGIELKTNIKKVGFGTELTNVKLRYSYKDTEGNLPDAYERLLMDAITGDQSLYLRTDEIAASWEFVDNIFQLWQSHKPNLYGYAQGSAGPQDNFDQDRSFEWI